MYSNAQSISLRSLKLHCAENITISWWLSKAIHIEMNSPQRTACLAKVNAKGPFVFTCRKFSNDGNWTPYMRHKEADTGHRKPEAGNRKLETGDRTDNYQILFSHGWEQPLRDNKTKLFKIANALIEVRLLLFHKLFRLLYSTLLSGWSCHCLLIQFTLKGVDAETMAVFLLAIQYLCNEATSPLLLEKKTLWNRFGFLPG